MSETRYYVEYVLTGSSLNTLLKVENELYIKKLIGTGTPGTIGIKTIPQTDLDIGGQIRVSTGSTNLEGEIRYKDKYLWINTGGTAESWSPLVSGSGTTVFSAATDDNFYYDDTTDTLYTPYINLSGITTAHPTNYYSLFIDKDTGLVYASGATSSGDYNVWIDISTNVYASTPACSSGITMTGSVPSDVVNGTALRWLAGSTYYYNQLLTRDDSGSRLWVRGAPLTSNIDKLSYSNDRNMIHTETFIIPGNYADSASSTLFRDDLLMGSVSKGGFYWLYSDASCIGMSLIHKIDDTGTVTRQPALTPYILSTNLLTNPLTASTSLVHNTGNVDTTKYKVSFGSQIELRVFAAAGTSPNNDASDLTVYLVFVMDS